MPADVCCSQRLAWHGSHASRTRVEDAQKSSASKVNCRKGSRGGTELPASGKPDQGWASGQQWQVSLCRKAPRSYAASQSCGGVARMSRRAEVLQAAGTRYIGGRAGGDQNHAEDLPGASKGVSIRTSGSSGCSQARMRGAEAERACAARWILKRCRLLLDKGRGCERAATACDVRHSITDPFGDSFHLRHMLGSGLEACTVALDPVLPRPHQA